MAISSGFSFQRVRTSVTAGVVATSFVFAGVPPDEVFRSGSGVAIASQGHALQLVLGQSVLRPSLLDVVADEPVFIPLVVSESDTPQQPASFLLESNKRGDIQPELYRRIIHEAERPRIPPASFLRASEDIEDITLDIERQVISLEQHGHAVPPSFLHFDPIPDAPEDPDQFATTRQLIHEAVRRAAEPPASFLHSTFLGTEVFRSAAGVAIASQGHADIPPPKSITLAGLLEVTEAPPEGQRLIVQAEPFVDSASFLLESNQREDILPELYRNIVHEAEKPRIPPQSIVRFEPIDDAPPDPDQFAVERRLVTEAEQPRIPPASFLLESNLRGDIQPELYRRVVHEAEQPQIPPQSYLHFVPIDDAPADPDQFSIKRTLVHQAESPRIPPQSYLLESNKRGDIQPELYRRIIQPPEPPHLPQSFLRDGQVPGDVAVVGVEGGGVSVSSQGHHEKVPRQSILRPSIAIEPKRTPGSLFFVSAEPYKPVEFAITRAGVPPEPFFGPGPELSIIVEAEQLVEPNRSWFHPLAPPPPGISVELARNIIVKAEQPRPSFSYVQGSVLIDDVIILAPEEIGKLIAQPAEALPQVFPAVFVGTVLPDIGIVGAVQFTGRHIAPTWS